MLINTCTARLYCFLVALIPGFHVKKHFPTTTRHIYSRLGLKDGIKANKHTPQISVPQTTVVWHSPCACQITICPAWPRVTPTLSRNPGILLWYQLISPFPLRILLPSSLKHYYIPLGLYLRYFTLFQSHAALIQLKLFFSGMCKIYVSNLYDEC